MLKDKQTKVGRISMSDSTGQLLAGGVLHGVTESNQSSYLGCTGERFGSTRSAKEHG